jgi:hypothetical protein
MVCSTSAALAQAAPQQGQSQPVQQSQPPSAWDTQFSSQNWSVSETRLEPLLVHFEMRMNRFYSGGAGEAHLILVRRADAIVRVGDFASYEVVEYRESLNSFIFGAQRVVEATIRLIPKI